MARDFLLDLSLFPHHLLESPAVKTGSPFSLIEASSTVGQPSLHTDEQCKADSLHVTKGCSPGNASCEGSFGRLKTQPLNPRNWLDFSVDQFIETVDACIRWCSDKKIDTPLGSFSLVECRARCGMNT